jgi:hypothetical protein
MHLSDPHEQIGNGIAICVDLTIIGVLPAPPSSASPGSLTLPVIFEGEVIKLIAEGLSNKEIAHRLNLATYTVKSHVHNILKKLAFQTRLVANYIHTQGTVKTQADDVPPPTTSPSS